jgi:hypothetical protein
MSEFRFTYPVNLSTDEIGRVIAEVPDVVGCVTDGADRGEALIEAADALRAKLWREPCADGKPSQRRATHPPARSFRPMH